ncbi:unnamed protein product [Caenorhabditis brenneri]
MKSATTIVDYQVLLNFITSGFFAESLVILCYGIEDTTREVYYEPNKNEEEESSDEEESEESEKIPDEVTISSDELKCKVCLLHFSDRIKKRSPRILIKCGHTLCHNCCKTLMKETGDVYILCPFCRTENYNFYFKKLPKNYIVIGMLQAIRNSPK